MTIETVLNLTWFFIRAFYLKQLLPDFCCQFVIKRAVLGSAPAIHQIIAIKPRLTQNICLLLIVLFKFMPLFVLDIPEPFSHFLYVLRRVIVIALSEKDLGKTNLILVGAGGVALPQLLGLAGHYFYYVLINNYIIDI